MSKKTIFFCIIISVLLYACSKQKNPTPSVITYTNNWDEDIHFMEKRLSLLHANLFHNITQAEFTNRMTKLRTETANLSKTQIIFELYKIFSRIGDSHSTIAASSSLEFYPITFEWVSDGIIITSLNSEEAQHLGEKIVSINSIPIETVIDSFRTVITSENEAWFKYRFVSFIRIAAFHKYFGFSNSASSTSFGLENGTQLDYSLEANNLSSIFENQTLPLYISNMTDYYWLKTLPEDQLLYIQYNKAKERTNLSFSDFTMQVNNQLIADTSLNKLVIDLRLNTGGNSGIIRPLITKLEELISTNRLDPSNIYVVIGKRTYSSAILNAYELKEAINPIFIGEPSGGKPNHYGHVKSFNLPKSNMTIYYSSRFWQITEGNEESLVPDILIELSSQDLLNARDPILEWVKVQ